MARAAWAGPSALRTAAENGTRAFNEHPETILRQITRLNDSERNAYAIGAHQAIRDKLARIRDGRDASGVAGLSEHTRAQLDAILTAVDDDPATRQQIAERLFASVRRENPIARTNNALTGNSRTALRQAADAADQRGDSILSSVAVDALTGSGGVATGLNLARGVVGRGVRGLGERLTAAGNAQWSGDILRLLGGQDQASVEAAMAELKQRLASVQRGNAVQAPSLIGGFLGGRTAAGLLAGPGGPRRGLLD